MKSKTFDVSQLQPGLPAITYAYAVVILETPSRAAESRILGTTVLGRYMRRA